MAASDSSKYTTPVTIRAFVEKAQQYTSDNPHYPKFGNCQTASCDMCGKENIHTGIHYGYICIDMCEDCYEKHKSSPSDDFIQVVRKESSVYFNTELRVVATDPDDIFDLTFQDSTSKSERKPAKRYIYMTNKTWGIIMGDPLESDSCSTSCSTSCSERWIKPGSKLTYDQMKFAMEIGTYCDPALSHYPKTYQRLQDLLVDKPDATDHDKYLTNGYSTFCACCGDVGLKQAVGYTDKKYTSLCFDICINCCVEFCDNNKITPNITGITLEELRQKASIEEAKFAVPDGYIYAYRQLGLPKIVEAKTFSQPIPTYKHY